MSYVEKVKRWSGVDHNNEPQKFVTLLASDYDKMEAALREVAMRVNKAQYRRSVFENLAKQALRNIGVLI